jgi:hypothetical protein
MFSQHSLQSNPVTWTSLPKHQENWLSKIMNEALTVHSNLRYENK